MKATNRVMTGKTVAKKKRVPLTPVQELLELISLENIPLSLIKKLLVEYYQIPENVFNGWVYRNKEAIYEHIHILSKLLTLAQRTNGDKRLPENRFKMFYCVEEFTRRFELIAAWHNLDKKEAA